MLLDALNIFYTVPTSLKKYIESLFFIQNTKRKHKHVIIGK
jgi:hypothetical protein